MPSSSSVFLQNRKELLCSSSPSVPLLCAGPCRLDPGWVEWNALRRVQVRSERRTRWPMRAELAESVATVLGPPAVAGAAELRVVGMRVVEQRAAGAAPVVIERKNNAKAVLGGRCALSRHGSPPPAACSPRRYRRDPSSCRHRAAPPRTVPASSKAAPAAVELPQRTCAAPLRPMACSSSPHRQGARRVICSPLVHRVDNSSKATMRLAQSWASGSWSVPWSRARHPLHS